MLTVSEVEAWIFKELSDYYPRIHHRAITGSLYISFQDARLGSVRIVNHSDRKKCNYRWNICLGQSLLCVARFQNKELRYYHSPDCLDNFKSSFIQFAEVRCA